MAHSMPYACQLQRATCTVLATTGMRRCPSPFAMAPKANEQTRHFRHALAAHRRRGSCSQIIVRVRGSRTKLRKQNNSRSDSLHSCECVGTAIARRACRSDGSAAQAALPIETRLKPKRIAVLALP